MTAAGMLLSLAAITGVAVPPAPQPALQDTACITMNTERLPLESRQSPLDSLTFTVGGHPVKLCYSRPAARDRAVFGVLVPYGTVWRTGANEPTMIHTTSAIRIAGIAVEPGTYSIYTIPGESQWEVIVNRAISQWGHESNYSEDVRTQEVGRGVVPSEQVERYTEQLTFEASQDAAGGTTLALWWERTAVAIPVTEG
jgi:hypothetical protein